MRHKAKPYTDHQDRQPQDDRPLRTYDECAAEWNRVSGQPPIGRGSVCRILRSALRKFEHGLIRELRSEAREGRGLKP